MFVFALIKPLAFFLSQFKCAHHEKEIWPWLMQELKPTMDRLGVPDPNSLGYDKPEFYFREMEDMD